MKKAIALALACSMSLAMLAGSLLAAFFMFSNGIFVDLAETGTSLKSAFTSPPRAIPPPAARRKCWACSTPIL